VLPTGNASAAYIDSKSSASNSSSGSSSGAGDLDNDYRVYDTEDGNTAIAFRRLTYCDWSAGSKSPRSFQTISEDEVVYKHIYPIET
jgi:hypothetical protein